MYFCSKKNMALYDIRPLQLRILKILEAVDKACREHGLNYYIGAGTMIGAVRHKGFIPWDDDLDIAMPRPDYDRLIAHAKEWLPAPFEMVCAENDDRIPRQKVRIHDLRPLQHRPETVSGTGKRDCGEIWPRAA